MKVILAKSAGFCWGVKRAVNKARAVAASNENAPVRTDGPLIHNKQMIELLRSDGIKEAKQPDKLTEGTLIIRAHGIPPERRKAIATENANLTDATCPDVAKIQGTIRNHARKGFYIVIFGDKGHAEVTGLLGFSEGRGYVINSPEEVDTLPNINPICIVSQSTQLPLSYDKISQAMLKRFPDAKIIDTICSSTKNRQQELLDIAKNVDAIVIVGGPHSANTMRLVELASSKRPTFHIETSSQIKSETFKTFKTVGLSAGASTPDFIIEEVKRALEEI